jgi:hypothetical protein
MLSAGSQIGPYEIVCHLGSGGMGGGAAYQAGISFSADGRSLATSVVGSPSDLWLLDGYPRPQPWWQFWK